MSTQPQQPQPQQSTALAIRRETIKAITDVTAFRQAQIFVMKRHLFKGDGDDADLVLFAMRCHNTGLDPFSGQICPVFRYSAQEGRKVMAIQTQIDGFRLIGHRALKERFGGIAGPYWKAKGQPWTDLWEEDGVPYAAKVGIRVAGCSDPTWGIALWSEFAQKNKEGKLIGMWPTMPANQLAKCFDADTEVLTDRGFERFDFVTGRIMQVSEGGLQATNASPFSQPWDGGMVTLESDDLNFCVTPNHDMLTTAGKIEAGDLYEAARARARHWIPRCVSGTREDALVSDDRIRLCGAYLADGYDRTPHSFAIAVSRPHKIALLQSLGGYASVANKQDAGTVVATATRTITTTTDKQVFTYHYSVVSFLCEPGKRIRVDQLLSLSQRQARILVDTLIAMDGHTQEKSGVRRFYCSDSERMGIFELACIVAGYSVSIRRQRTSDISSKPNYSVTVSGRNEIPVSRWGRTENGVHHCTKQHTGLSITPNLSGQVWCVTVPSGVIVVRRHGFSMLCGNCAEAQAWRKVAPQDTANLRVKEEIPEEESFDQQHREIMARQDTAAPAPQPIITRVEGAMPGWPTPPMAEPEIDVIDGEVVEVETPAEAPAIVFPEEVIAPLKAFKAEYFDGKDAVVNLTQPKLAKHLKEASDRLKVNKWAAQQIGGLYAGLVLVTSGEIVPADTAWKIVDSRYLIALQTCDDKVIEGLLPSAKFFAERKAEG